MLIVRYIPFLRLFKLGLSKTNMSPLTEARVERLDEKCVVYYLLV